ncbi:MAG: hypothetical protein WKH64_06955 [Chloroflexia bacterium]
MSTSDNMVRHGGEVVPLFLSQGAQTAVGSPSDSRVHLGRRTHTRPCPLDSA